MQNNTSAARNIGKATLDRYLSAILALSAQLPIVRSVDVARRLDCSKACVSMALKQMQVQALVRVEAHGALVLSKEGLRRAERWQRRCDFFEGLLRRCGVCDDTAVQEAQAVARALSAETGDAVMTYLKGI